MNVAVFSISVIAIMMVYGYVAGRHHVNAGLWLRIGGHNIMIPFDLGIAVLSFPVLLTVLKFAPAWWGIPAILLVSGFGAYLHAMAVAFGAGYGIGLKRVPLKRSAESIAVNAFLSSLTEHQARILFGTVLTPNQVMVLFDVASHFQPSTALDSFFRSLTTEQLDAIQNLFNTKQLALFLVFAKKPDPSTERAQ